MRAPHPWPVDGSAPSVRLAGVTLMAIDPLGEVVWASSLADKRQLVLGTTGGLWATRHGERAVCLFRVPRGLAMRDLKIRQEIP